ncbi:anti-sigma factor [Paracidovorax valerianellae]|uniref:Regulator of SigK n=1 Tax=Paracidovorax valerianellae TaxID=187868 RepID=A0A1G7FC10_9BURK|nr:anti-sigma factor [Paracidovorax valerianellae]MDA8444398.1 anti-sigma factor [Paracidovorax valerianellae]SDE73488.1 Anti-sigma-K factor RskA [Paracidovorax valerianellae]
MTAAPTPGTGLPGNPEDLHWLAGEYVLGTLPAAARRQVEQRLAAEPALQRAVAEWEARLLPLTGLAEPIAPPEQLWARIDASLQAADGHRAQDWAQRTAPATPRPAMAAPLRNWWNHLGLWRGLAGSGFAMAAVLAAVLVTRVAPQAAAPQFMVVLVAPQDKAPGWVVQASSPQSIQLIPLGVAEVPADRALEFWTKADSWSGPVSLGLVKPGQPLRLALERLPPLQPNQLFELTLEPPSGSPVGKPTGPIQYIGRAVKVL